MDDSKALHGKLLINQTSFENWSFGLPCLVNFRSEMPPGHLASSRISAKLPNTLLRDREDTSFVEARRPSALIVKNEKRQTGSNLHDGEGWQRNSFMQTRCFGNWLMSLKLAAWQNSSIFVFHSQRNHHCVSFFPILNVHEAPRYFQLRCNGRFGHGVRLHGSSGAHKRFVLQKIGKL